MEEIESGEEQYKDWQVPEGSKESELSQRQYEYRDSEGNFLGRARVELGTEEIDITGIDRRRRALEGGAAKGFAVKSLVLQSEQEGMGEIDVLALANKHGMEVVMAAQRLDNYSYADHKGTVIVPPLDADRCGNFVA